MWAAGSGMDPGLGSRWKCTKLSELHPAILSPSGGTALSSLQWVKIECRVNFRVYKLCLRNTAINIDIPTSSPG